VLEGSRTTNGCKFHSSSFAVVAVVELDVTVFVDVVVVVDVVDVVDVVVVVAVL